MISAFLWLTPCDLQVLQSVRIDDHGWRHFDSRGTTVVWYLLAASQFCHGEVANKSVVLEETMETSTVVEPARQQRMTKHRHTGDGTEVTPQLS